MDIKKEFNDWFDNSELSKIKNLDRDIALYIFEKGADAVQNSIIELLLMRNKKDV